MLSRTLSRTGYQSGRGRWRKIVLLLVPLLALTLGYFALPEPGPRVRDSSLTDEQLRASVQTMLTSNAATPADRATRDAASLGRKLFRDARLSGSGEVACATCHDPEHAFAGAGATVTASGLRTFDAPSVANAAFSTWFNWDGRSDSLVSQALDATEDPRQLATSRVAVVRHLLANYRKDYEAAFGAFPAALTSDVTLPRDGTAARAPLALSIDVAAHALSTVGTYDLMRDLLQSAQVGRRAPAMELSRRAIEEGRPMPPLSWVADYEALPLATRQAVDQAFVNYGRALAEYQRGLIATDSPFDRFARRLASGAATKEALAQGFGDQELTGLKLFLGPGNCALCHSGAGLSDQQFHNVGLPTRSDAEDAELLQVDVGRATGILRAKADPFNCISLGTAATTTAESCRELPYLDGESLMFVGAYKTPSLRNVGATAPYMHDGRFETLTEVLAHYNDLEARPAIGIREGTLKPANFTKEEIAALSAFLGSLTSVVRDSTAEESVGAAP